MGHKLSEDWLKESINIWVNYQTAWINGYCTDPGCKNGSADTRLIK